MADEGQIMNISKLMHVADRAKTIGFGDFTLPNAVFALLLSAYFVQKGNDEEEKEKQTLSLWLETQDTDGSSPSEAFYDLFVLDLLGEDGVIASLCIPAPLLEPRSIITAMKSVSLVERKEHLRAYEEGEGQNEMSELWDEVFKEVDANTLVSVATTYLVPGCFIHSWMPEEQEEVALAKK